MRFRFEPILNLRKHHEDSCRTQLYKEETKLIKIQEEINAWNSNKEHQQKKVKAMSVGIIKPDILACSSECLEYIRQKQIETKNRKIVQEEQRNIARELLIDARKEKKTMEKLKEQFIAREEKRMMDLEQKKIDEVAVNQFHRDKG